MRMPNAALLNKYNIPVPRYTSYPAVPHWKNGMDAEKWKDAFIKQFYKSNSTEGISLYLHLPFCESLCTYCGCNKKITTNHNVEEEYISVILKEWQMYRALMNEVPVIREIHLGGGTPTFFSPVRLNGLVKGILKGSLVHPDSNFSLEGHPNNTTKEHLEILFEIGFRRISYGVQDNDPKVQKVINRIQPFENVQKAIQMARDIGYQSVNFDLIYGLPFQTHETIERSILQCISLKPDRIAYYSYAHVPWTSRGQRLFDEQDLPSAEEKMKLYQTGKELFSDHGYADIGMDHFALPEDELYIARQQGNLHRNFMGYTVQHTRLLLGLGVSAISDAGTAFAQNSKSLHDYYRHINSGETAIEKGYFLSGEDETFRRYIHDISCGDKTFFVPAYREMLETYSFPELTKLKADGLVDFDKNQITVTPEGRNFIRNICRAFDLHLLKNKAVAENPLYSKAI